MSLTLSHIDTDCQFSLTEIRMRVSAIKSRWSDAERGERAAAGQSRCQRLAAVLGCQLSDAHGEPADGLALLEADGYACV
jgi:hypothetical protein